MSRSITINTVTAPSFLDGRETLTPRLKLTVSYDEGGTSMFTGQHRSRCYCVSVEHDRISDRGFTSIILDGKGNPSYGILPAKRFSASKLKTLAQEVIDGKHDALVEMLYAKAVSNRSEHAWPESIKPEKIVVTA